MCRRINRRFGTAFHEFQHTEENVKSVFADIERDYSGAYEEGAPLELVVARPSSVRDEAKAGMHTRFRSEVHAGLRLRAIRLFDVFREATGPRSSMSRPG